MKQVIPPPQKDVHRMIDQKVKLNEQNLGPKYLAIQLSYHSYIPKTMSNEFPCMLENTCKCTKNTMNENKYSKYENFEFILESSPFFNTINMLSIDQIMLSKNF
jgi:hypothetical protein